MTKFKPGDSVTAYEPMTKGLVDVELTEVLQQEQGYEWETWLVGYSQQGDYYELQPEQVLMLNGEETSIKGGLILMLEGKVEGVTSSKATLTITLEEAFNLLGFLHAS